MRRETVWFALAMMAAPAIGFAATEAQASQETCAEIRQRIDSTPPGDPALLRLLAARSDCRFAAAEVYRAAHGDKPIPPDPPQRHRDREYDEEDRD